MFALILQSIRDFSIPRNNHGAVGRGVFPTILVFLAAAFTGSAQETAALPLPPFAVTVSTAPAELVHGGRNPVTISITNQTKVKLSLSTRADFRLIDKEAKSETRLDANFYAPVNLLRNYESGVNRCQSDLSFDRVKTKHQGQLVIISPQKATLLLAPGETRIFHFDLTQLCWNYTMSSIYPNLALFELLADYPTTKGKDLALSVEGYPSGSTKLDDGRVVDDYTDIVSNEILMTVR